jgi:hypothetical protein
MRQLKTFKIISIVSYLLIILTGQMIGLPFFSWLLFTLFDFGNKDQLFAFLGVLGLTISFVTFNSTRTAKVLLSDIISLVLLASPILRRITDAPIALFNYWGFIIPATIFALSYIVSICFSVKQYLRTKKDVV